MDRIKWSIKASAIDDNDLIRVLEECVKIEVSAVEIGYGHIQSYSSNELSRIHTLYKNKKILIDSFHLPFLYGKSDDDLACLYDSQRKLAVEKMIFWLNKVAPLKIRVAVLHPSVCPWEVCEQDKLFSMQLCKSIKDILPVAKKHKIILAVENMPGYPNKNLFGSRPEHFLALLNNISSPFLGICFDTGHAWMAGVWEKMFETLKNRIVHFHIHDNFGKDDIHLPPGEGVINWIDFFNKIRAISYRNPIFIEASPLCDDNYSCERWKEMIRAVEKYINY
ncbi:MAG TPA: sugar phosphate isomerase/epimerase family protein [bacterium]|nr:sugar phosphate isomerase/epimerase family protein [bacterium]HPP30307.1 sugar phosphate isomerase/epimerase family protein [bacterium]